jgi:type I restriction enzyme, S subunit
MIVGISEEQEQIIIDILKPHFKEFSFFYYGSRVKGGFEATSDLDILIKAKTNPKQTKIPSVFLEEIKEKFDQSNLPFVVNFSEFAGVDDGFFEIIRRDLVRVDTESKFDDLVFLRIKDYPVQIVDGDRGKNYPKKEEFFENEHCLFLNTGNVSKSGFNFDNTVFITSEKNQKLRKGLLQRGDILLTTRGTVGNTAFYSNAIKYDVVRINSGMVILRPDSNKLNSGFFYNVIRSEIFQSQSRSFQYGTAQPQLPIGTLQQIVLPLPPIQTQQKIAGILSAYDDLIENNNRRIKILEEMAQMLYKEWFIDFKFPNHLITKFIDSEFGRIPEEWEVGKIGDINSVGSGYAFKGKDLKDSGDISIIKIKNIQSGVVEMKDTSYIEEAIAKKACKFELFAGDILIAMTGAQVGKVGFVPRTKNRLFLNQRVGKFIPNKNYITNNQFIAQFLKTKNFQSQINNTAQGAAQPNISSSQIEGIELLIPNKELIIFYENAIDSVVKEIELLIDKNQNLKKTRDLLLPRLISGEISVENLEVKYNERTQH